MSSSTTTALSRQPLVQVLRNITDPRDRRGVRHNLSTVLSLAVTGVLAGCRSLTAIWEHATDLTTADLEALGLAAGQALPSESTIRRVLQNLDPADVDAHLRSWLCTRTGTIEGRTVIAVDGKTMRGARTSKDPAPHLLAALDHATGAVLTQQRVADKSNEIPALRELLEPLDLEGVVVSADAMHTQTGTARWITRRGGHYVLTVKGNQKTLRKTLKALPFKSVSRPSQASMPVTVGGCGVLSRPSRLPPGWTSPGLRRWSRPDAPGPSRAGSMLRWSTRVCSLPMTDAQPEAIAAWIQGHWGIENRLHVGQRRHLRRGPPPATHR